VPRGLDICEHPLVALEFCKRFLGGFPDGQQENGSKEDLFIDWCLAMTKAASNNNRCESQLAVPCEVIDPLVLEKDSPLMRKFDCAFTQLPAAVANVQQLHQVNTIDIAFLHPLFHLLHFPPFSMLQG
jgi:hypothetical protein